ncbi:MAG: hypothetical protein IJI66_08530 [Erysipelotrichaceae bacterium]|nr:hypothetical protein [Erysipelotrichaceae bacterium]
MKLTTAQKVLKIVGIITIIGAILVILLGVLATTGIGNAVEQNAAALDDAEVSTGAGLMMLGGIALIVGGFFDFVTGILSVMTSKNGKYAKVTLILTIISVVYSIVNSVANYTKSGFTTSNVIMLIVEIVLSVLLCVAANTVKVAFEEGRI